MAPKDRVRGGRRSSSHLAPDAVVYGIMQPEFHLSHKRCFRSRAAQRQHALQGCLRRLSNVFFITEGQICLAASEASVDLGGRTGSTSVVRHFAEWRKVGCHTMRRA
jgi:hypothetical protein